MLARPIRFVNSIIDNLEIKSQFITHNCSQFGNTDIPFLKIFPLLRNVGSRKTMLCRYIETITTVRTCFAGLNLHLGIPLTRHQRARIVLVLPVHWLCYFIETCIHCLTLRSTVLRILCRRPQANAASAFRPWRISKRPHNCFQGGIGFRSSVRGSAFSVHRVSWEFFEVIQVLMERLFEGCKGQECGNDADGPDCERAEL
jgi:hypothetical protein